MSNHEKIQSPRPADKKLLDEQASDAGHHSGRQHPPTQKVVDAKQDKKPQAAAHSDRRKTLDGNDSKY